MKNHSLLFLPDISGFTGFVNNTELEHSRHIVSELFEIMIDANTLNLQLAEIEGDALFFYKTGDIPDLQAIQDQVRNMFLKFHMHLRIYEHQRICHCGACRTAQNLRLKFVAHTGPIDFIKVHGFTKPHGTDVILAHRLLKNPVPIDEYLLLTDQMFETWTGDDSRYLKGVTEYDVGEVLYRYMDLTPMLDQLDSTEIEKWGFESSRPIRFSLDVDRPPEELFEIIHNFKYRHLWNPVDQLKYEKNRVNRVGMRHECVINDKTLEFNTITKPNHDDKMIYGERSSDFPLIKQASTFFIVEPNGDASKLNFEIHLEPKGILSSLLLPFIKKIVKPNFRKTIHRLKEAAERREDQKIK